MAKTRIVPRNGSVAITGFGGTDFNSIEIESSQNVEDVTPYGSNGMGQNTGTGTPTQTLTCGGFGTKGVAGSSPGLTNVGAFDALGVAATITLDTGCTYAGSYVQESTRLTHHRMRAAVPLVFRLKNASDITEVWATSGS